MITPNEVKLIIRDLEQDIAGADLIDDQIIRKAWAVSGLWEWQRGIRDRDRGYEGDNEEIAEYFRMCGWQWYLDAHGGGTYVETFERKDGTVGFMEWCGIFHGASGSTIGAILDYFGHPGTASLAYGVRYFVMPGTPRLASAKKWKQAGVRPFENVDPAFADVGDIVTVGRSRIGSHIVMVIERDGNYFTTLEGNARGLQNNGDVFEGVCVKQHRIREIKRVYRPSLEQFVGV